VPPGDVERALAVLAQHGEQAQLIGSVERGAGGVLISA
jgi:hypothetical protein